MENTKLMRFCKELEHRWHEASCKHMKADEMTLRVPSTRKLLQHANMNLVKIAQKLALKILGMFGLLRNDS